MDRSHASQDLEKSIVCVLASMKHVLSTTENTCFMGANRQNIDVIFTSFSESSEYAILHKFINEKLIVPLITGLKYSFYRVYNNHLTLIYNNLAGFNVSQLNSSEVTNGRSSHVRIMHYAEEGKCN